MSFLKYPDNGRYQDRNDVIDQLNELDSYTAPLEAEDHNALVDAWVDLFSWYPPLWGPNSDSAKDAIKNSLNNMVNHQNALQDALDMLNPPTPEPTDFDTDTDGDGIPDELDDEITPPDIDPDDLAPDPLEPPPPPRDPLVLDTDQDGFISNIALKDSSAYFDITGDGIREKALELQAGGIQAIAEGFEEFSDMWSGYTELIDSMKEKYNLVGDVNLAEIDKRVWILERLTNTTTETPTIEARLEALLKAHANETLSEALITQSVIPSYQYGLWHVAVNSRDFKIKRGVA